MTVAISKIRVGHRVRAERDEPSHGTWPRYAGKVGTVVHINRTDSEIGVDFSPGGNRHSGTAWFRPTELTLVSGQRPVKLPQSAGNRSRGVPVPQGA